MNSTEKPYIFSEGKLEISVFPAQKPESPVIYMHGMDGFAKDVLPLLDQQVQNAGLPDFSLVTITVPYDEWSNILAPWNTPAGWPQYVACTGGAPEYLRIFTEKIIPEAEKHIEKPGPKMIAGYSLGGLFALWAEAKTGLFARLACPSGSFWFPNFISWFMKQNLPALPECIYFSSSEEEYNSENEYLKEEKPAIQALINWCHENQIRTDLVIDPGNHYEDVVKRSAAAIAWMLRN